MEPLLGGMQFVPGTAFLLYVIIAAVCCSRVNECLGIGGLGLVEMLKIQQQLRVSSRIALTNGKQRVGYCSMK